MLKVKMWYVFSATERVCGRRQGHPASVHQAWLHCACVRGSGLQQPHQNPGLVWVYDINHYNIISN